MRHLLAVERYKFARSRVVYGILGCIAVVIGLNLLQSTGNFPVPGFMGIVSPARWDILLTVWFPIFIAYFVAMEFQNKTINDALCLGKSRIAVYFAKLTAVLWHVVLLVVIIMVAKTIGLTIFNGFGEIEPLYFLRHALQAFVLQVFFQFSVASLFLMAAFIIKTPTLTVIVGIGYTVFTWFGGIMVREFLFGGRFTPYTYWLPALFNMEAIINTDPQGILRGSIVSIVWIIATTFIGCAVFKRTDLK
ncbi:MAG: ABC transporter permease [Defluviitaleaceae bacterium]|nr:ABC transporter permease [Defluviitaleaceae bacterium]MCL2275917.1 ABC transporter permease [Defluviitaleaceae bacterium]